MAIVTLKSSNRKLGDGVSATYASMRTCPSDCAMKTVCYGNRGPLRWHWDRIGKTAPATAYREAQQEAKALGSVPDGRLTRLHVVGDTGTDAGARIIAKAATRLRAWTYTHFWRVVKRRSWGKVSVLASCESTADVRKAQRRGYAAALVVERFPSEKAFQQDGLKVVPCPEQTGRAASCESCQLCLRDGQLKKAGIVIGFQLHGPKGHEKHLARAFAKIQEVA